MISKIETLKLIKSIGTRGRTLDKDIQTACVSAVFYSVCYGDVTIGQRLIDSVNAGSRKAAIVGFMEHYGNFEWKGKTVMHRQAGHTVKMEVESLIDGTACNAVEEFSLLEDIEASEAYCEAIKVQWTEFKPEQVKSSYNCYEEVKSFLSRMEKAIKKGDAVNADAYMVLAKAWEEFQEEKEVEDMSETGPEFSMLKAA